jgi:hypothetical protein
VAGQQDDQFSSENVRRQSCMLHKYVVRAALSVATALCGSARMTTSQILKFG